jgi:glycosyltransferase involved in cell wall biosynthesis
VLYSRDVVPLVVASVVRPHRPFAYEGHQLSRSSLGRFLQRVCLRKARVVFAVTEHLAAEYRRLGAGGVIVARDGFREERFASLPARDEARRATSLPARAFVVGYVGRLHTMGIPKGVDCLIDAIARLADPAVHLCVVGGPVEHVAALRSLWSERGLSPTGFHAVGEVPPAAVPTYLAAFDVGAMPFPSNEHFAYYASPLKLFEYLAAGRAIVASALPSLSEVVKHGETALLVAPDDAGALASAIARLRDDPPLRERLEVAARGLATGFAWKVRAARVLAALSA